MCISGLEASNLSFPLQVWSTIVEPPGKANVQQLCISGSAAGNTAEQKKTLPTYMLIMSSSQYVDYYYYYHYYIIINIIYG